MQPISDESFKILITIMDHFYKLCTNSYLSTKFKQTLKSMLFETSYKKGARILSAGSKQHIVWFMLEGLAREIRVHPDTFDENTTWFWFTLSFLYTTPGFFSREPSESTIELLEDCKVVLISYIDWAKLKDAFEETEIVTEKIRGGNDNIRHLHADDIKNLSTDERYLKHEQTLNDLFGCTQLRYIAEYMGMSPDTLGKLRKKHGGGGSSDADPI